MITSPSIGRQGKALRRRQRRGIPESSVNQEESTCSSFSQITSNTKGSGSHLKPKKIETGNKMIYFNLKVVLSFQWLCSCCITLWTFELIRVQYITR